MHSAGLSVAKGMSARRRAMLPSSTLPLIYFGGAHVAFGTAAGAVAAAPEVLGTFFYHPRALAIVHLVTLGWISGSILGALYIVAPLAMGISFRAGRLDHSGCASFWAGTSLMVAGFWSGRYGFVAAGASFVLGSVLVVGARLARGLGAARLPQGIGLHVGLAFLNLVMAGSLGVALALGRGTAAVPGSPMALAAAHAHLAALGWAAMMVMGIGYRLIPMFAPAAMPAGRGLALSAVLMETGTAGLVIALATGGTLMPWTLCVTGGFAAFLVRIATVLHDRRPRPADLPRRDWSTWQAYAALACLVGAIGAGIRIAWGGAGPAWIWTYGVLGLVGFLAQIVAGIGGRLLPMYGWYRSLERRDGVIPSQSVHRLIEPRLAGAVFALWLVGLPTLTVGLAAQSAPFVSAGAAALLGATVASAWHVLVILRRAASASDT